MSKKNSNVIYGNFTKKEKQKSKNSRISCAIFFICTSMVWFYVWNSIYSWYSKYHSIKHKVDTRIMYCPSDNIHFILKVGYSLVILIALSSIFIATGKNSFIKMVRKIFFVSVLIGLLLYLQAFNYWVISQDGLYIKKNVFSKERSYYWDEIKSIEVGANDKFEIYYILHMEDGLELDLATSKDFWSNIVHQDKFFSTRDIDIKRMEINKKVKEELKKIYGPKSGENLLGATVEIDAYEDVVAKILNITQ